MESLNEPNDSADSLVKQKTKKPRTDAQIASTQKMLTALEDKKMKLKAIKDKLNNAPPIPVSPDTSDEESEEEPPPKKKEKKMKDGVLKQTAVKPVKAKKEPKVIYQSASESEEEIIIVKKKKKPAKKTIIYESESEEEEPIKPSKNRETKSQQNTKSSFKVSHGETKPIVSQPQYYFA